jgi:uncharacterized membrane protein
MAQTQRYSVGSEPGRSSSSAALAVGALAPALAAVGALLANRGITPPFGGFLLFAAAIPLSLLAIVLAFFAFVARAGDATARPCSRPARPSRSRRSRSRRS